MQKATLTDEIARELYEAREQLDARGKRPNGRSWGDYLNDVGLAQRTVRRWLEHFDGRKNNYGNQYANVSNDTTATWSKYLEDVGLARKIVHRTRQDS